MEKIIKNIDVTNDGFTTININENDWVFEIGDTEIKTIIIYKSDYERELDNCYCTIWKNGNIKYSGNEEWQCSDYIRNPKFPQELPGGIGLNEKDYNEATRILKNFTLEDVVSVVYS